MAKAKWTLRDRCFVELCLCPVVEQAWALNSLFVLEVQIILPTQYFLANQNPLTDLLNKIITGWFLHHDKAGAVA